MAKNNTSLKRLLKGKCPKCGDGRLFDGIMTTADKCNSCGYEYDFETADGPAFFAITIVGTLMGILAGVVEIIYQPSLALHLIWIPLTFIFSFIIIRITKSLMIWHQFEIKEKS